MNSLHHAVRMQALFIAVLWASTFCASVQTAPTSASATAPAKEKLELVPQLGLGDWVQAAAFSPDGRLVLTGGNNAARLWDAASGRQIRSFVASLGLVTAVAFSADGRLVFGAA